MMTLKGFADTLRVVQETNHEARIFDRGWAVTPSQSSSIEQTGGFLGIREMRVHTRTA